MDAGALHPGGQLYRRFRFGRLASLEELRAWLDESGFESVEVARRGLFAYFAANRS